jgi:FtsZ-interacting cell division protein ZipA
MSDTNLTQLLGLITSGGASGVIALLILVVTGLLWDRRRVFSDNAKKDEKLDALMESHYKSNIAVSEALNSIKIVLAEISVKLIR